MMYLQLELAIAVVDFILTYPDISQSDLRGGMVENHLQHCNIFELFVMVIPHGLSHTVSAYVYNLKRIITYYAGFSLLNNFPRLLFVSCP